jgi:two-component system chemotaxis response regulator CheB
MAKLYPATPKNVEKLGTPSAFTCPECDGPLWEIQDKEILRFRCRVGHAYTSDNVLAEKYEVLENALYTALNTLEESAAMAERLAARSRENEHEHAARRFEEQARSKRQQAVVIRQVLIAGAADAV